MIKGGNVKLRRNILLLSLVAMLCINFSCTMPIDLTIINNTKGKVKGYFFEGGGQSKIPFSLDEEEILTVKKVTIGSVGTRYIFVFRTGTLQRKITVKITKWSPESFKIKLQKEERKNE